ncbi:MAG: 4Fe-4S binding protein, partial [Zoogloeaceae bacterium]|nr:4Fe-4S binding protein [Zoogloeaceae bacterium]
HYKVDRSAWDQETTQSAPGGTTKLCCPPLVDVRRMVSASDCHACARCAGQRGAVRLTGRSPFAEILDPAIPARSRDALTLLFGVLGVATAAFQWTVSPWFLKLKMALATWLVERDAFTLLESNAPWWMLTHYPERNDVFTWLDGLLVLGYLLGGGFLLGLALLFGPLAAAWIARRFAATPDAPRVLNWQRFALTLTPLGAASVILGLTMTTITQLRGELLLLSWAPLARIAFLSLGCFLSLWPIFALVRKYLAGIWARIAVFLAMCLPVALMATLWSLAFLVW